MRWASTSRRGDPKKKRFTWFDCNFFWWGPLWQFVVVEAGDLIPDDVAVSGYFSEETVRDFRDFCRGSGGFWIW